MQSPMEKKKDKHASVITVMAKIAKVHIFADRACNFYSQVLWYARFDDMIFIRIPLILESISPISKIR